MAKHHSFYQFLSLFFTCNLLIACTYSHKDLLIVEKIEKKYQNVINLNKDYQHGVYGSPDPASFNRLQRYQADASQAVAQFRKDYNNSPVVPQQSLNNAKEKINIYVSYLNALGATSATKNTFTGF